MVNLSIKQKLFPRVLLLFAVILTCVFPTHADEVTIDNIKYAISGKKAIVLGLDDESLTKVVNIPASIDYNHVTYSVTEIGEAAFKNCEEITAVSIPNSVITIDNMAFEECASLPSVTIPNSVTSIGFDAFKECFELTSIVIPNSVTQIGDYAFCWCTRLTYAYIPSSVVSLGLGVFSFCPALKKIYVESGNIYYATDESGALYNRDFSILLMCPSSKTTFEIPKTVTTIKDSAFSGCENLISVSIPGSVTTIEDYAFDSCSELTSINIPSSVKSLGESVFHYCYALTSVTCSWEEPLTECEDVFDNTPCDTLYVPIGTKAKYANVAPWSGFKQIIETVISGINDIAADNVHSVRSENGAICVDGDTDVRIVSMNGSTVYSGRGETRINLTPGVYIVIINNTSTKVAVN